MLHEHAVTYKYKLSMPEIDYIVKKANKLGKSGRDVLRVHEETDSEGTHIYFDVTGLNEQKRSDEII